MHSITVATNRGSDALTSRGVYGHLGYGCQWVFEDPESETVVAVCAGLMGPNPADMAYGKLVMDTSQEAGAWHLYNVVDDPGETRNIAKEKPALLKELRETWDHYAQDVGVVLSK